MKLNNNLRKIFNVKGHVSLNRFKKK